jgi:hypothetical protein
MCKIYQSFLIFAQFYSIEITQKPEYVYCIILCSFVYSKYWVLLGKFQANVLTIDNMKNIVG